MGAKYPQLCLDFVKGSCSKGGGCTFCHTLEEQRSHPSYKTDPCTEFAKNGKCVYGETCGFYHDTSEQWVSSTKRVKKPTTQRVSPHVPSVPEMCYFINKPVGCKNRDSCKFCHTDDQYRALYKTRPCSTYRNSGICPRGEGCGFYHDESERRWPNQEDLGYEGEENYESSLVSIPQSNGNVPGQAPVVSESFPSLNAEQTLDRNETEPASWSVVSSRQPTSPSLAVPTPSLQSLSLSQTAVNIDSTTEFPTLSTPPRPASTSIPSSSREASAQGWTTQTARRTTSQKSPQPQSPVPSQPQGPGPVSPPAVENKSQLPILKNDPLSLASTSSSPSSSSPPPSPPLPQSLQKPPALAPGNPQGVSQPPGLHTSAGDHIFQQQQQQQQQQQRDLFPFWFPSEFQANVSRASPLTAGNSSPSQGYAAQRADSDNQRALHMQQQMCAGSPVLPVVPPPPMRRISECVVCFEECNDLWVVVPCGHRVLCKNCATEHNNAAQKADRVCASNGDHLQPEQRFCSCPKCRTKITMVIQIFEE